MSHEIRWSRRECSLAGGDAGEAPAVGLDIGYARNDDGTWNSDQPVFLNPVAWDEWIRLPVREFDFEIRSAKLRVRVPTVIIPLWNPRCRPIL